MSADGPPPTATPRDDEPLHDGSAINAVELTITGDASGVVLRRKADAKTPSVSSREPSAKGN